MGKNRKPAEIPDEFEGLAVQETLPLDICRLAFGQEPVEGLPGGLYVSPGEHGLGNMRSSDYIAAGVLEHLLLE